MPTVLKVPSDWGMCSDEGNRRITEIAERIVETFDLDCNPGSKLLLLYDSCVVFHRLAGEYVGPHDTTVATNFKKFLSSVTQHYWGWSSADLSNWLYEASQAAGDLYES